jgi:hypothetical protein
MGVLVKAGSSTYSSAGTALSYGAGVSNSSVPTAYGSGGASGMPQQFSVIGADNSPFAMFGADNYEMPMAYGMSVAAPLSAGTTNPSSRGGGSRHGDQSSRSDNASGRSSMLASAESGRDGMGPLPALGGNHSPEKCVAIQTGRRAGTGCYERAQGGRDVIFPLPFVSRLSRGVFWGVCFGAGVGGVFLGGGAPRCGLWRNGTAHILGGVTL